MQLLKSVRALKPRAIKAQLNSAIQDEQMHKLTVYLLAKRKKILYWTIGIVAFSINSYRFRKKKIRFVNRNN